MIVQRHDRRVSLFPQCRSNRSLSSCGSDDTLSTIDSVRRVRRSQGDGVGMLSGRGRRGPRKAARGRTRRWLILCLELKSARAFGREWAMRVLLLTFEDAMVGE